jgi:subtilisin-like proprotein convertase family protein
MKTMKLLIPLLLTAGGASAAVFTASDNTGGSIPDGSSAGLARSLSINAPGQSIVSVEISVNLSAFGGGPAYLGDLYLYLTNGSEISVLANRPGRTTLSPFGYDDDQSMNVSFSQTAASDLHGYRLPVTGSHTIALSGPLTGIWQPDGRFSDPSSVLDTDARTAGLDVFNGDLATGTWSLFAADLSSGAAHELDSWTITINTIPEPGSAALLLTALAAAARRRR